MAADEDDQDDVRRVLERRPPEDLPAGAEDRLRRRLDAERSRKPRGTPAKPIATSKRKAVKRRARK